MTAPFTREGFIAACEDAIASGGGQRAIRPLLEHAVSDRARITAELGEPTRAGAAVLYRSRNVTILNLVWGPHITAMPHNHHMWAVIGMYAGREDNIFWRVLPEDAKWPIEAAGVSSFMPGDVGTLGPDIIHSVTNPLGKLTAALHVYGGDFLNQAREEWDEETLRPDRFDMDRARRRFEESNRFLVGG